MGEDKAEASGDETYNIWPRPVRLSSLSLHHTLSSEGYSDYRHNGTAEGKLNTESNDTYSEIIVFPPPQYININ